MANIGRDLLVKTGVTVIAGVRTKGVSVNNEAIDVSNDDSNGFRTLLDVPGQKSLDIAIDGITESTELRVAIHASTTMTLTDCSIEYPNGDTITGTFMLTSLEESGSYNDAMTFSGTLQSSGTWVYTAV